MNDVVTAAPVEGQAAPPADTGVAATPAPAWTDGLEGDLKGYVETKGFTDVGALATSYKNLESLRGVPETQLLKLPADMTDAAQMGDVYSRLGRPETAEGYTNVLGEGFDTATFKAATAKAHELGLSDGQLKGMQEVMATSAQEVQAAQDETASAAFDAWKTTNDKGFNDAVKVMATVGMDEAQLEGLLAGDKTQMYDFLARVASRSSEGQVVLGDAPGDLSFSMTPAAATAKKAELLNDPVFSKAYLGPNNAEAVKRITDLQKIISNEKE